MELFCDDASGLRVPRLLASCGHTVWDLAGSKDTSHTPIIMYELSSEFELQHCSICSANLSWLSAATAAMNAKVQYL
jgi:hypothetical protein